LTYINWDVDTIFLSEEGIDLSDGLRFITDYGAMKTVQENCRHLYVPTGFLSERPGNLKRDRYEAFGRLFGNLKTCTLGPRKNWGQGMYGKLVLRAICRPTLNQDPDSGLTRHPKQWCGVEHISSHRHFLQKNPHLKVFLAILDGKGDFGTSK
jgi:hypothetical protein